MKFGRTSLEDFLSDETTNDGNHRGKITGSLVRKLGENLLVKDVFASSSRMDLLGERYDLLSVGGVTRSRKMASLFVKCRKSLETNVQDGGSVPLGKISNEKFGVSERLFKSFLYIGLASCLIYAHITDKLKNLGHLHLGEETARFVLAQPTGVADGESVRTYLNVSFFSVIN